MRRSIPSTAASAPSSSGAVDEPVQTLTVKRSPREAASVTRRTSAAGTAFGWPEPVNPLIPTWLPGAMNAAASSADITLSATALHRRRDRSVIPMLPPASKRRDDPVSARRRMASRPRPGAFGPATGYGSRLRQQTASAPAVPVTRVTCRVGGRRPNQPAGRRGSAARAQNQPAARRVPAGLPAGSVRGESHLDRQDENGKNQFNKSVRDEPAQR